MFTAFSLNTSAGQIFADTKLDLVVNPWGFLRKAVHLWDPSGSGGQLQNQAYGYLFPMGPFFALGHAVGIPGWVTQRLWWAMLLVVSYTGFVALSRRLGVGTEWTRLVAGVGFALAPHVLTVIGRSSVEVWPPALAAWVLVPLVGSARTGRLRRAAGLSGLAIFAMGGVNAAVDLAAILPAVLWLGTRRWDRALLRLTLWWAAAALAATLWWVIPLLEMARYSPPFLDYIETASVTTSTTSLVEALRGTSDWVGYVLSSGSRAGLALLSDRILLLNSALVVIGGLAGLASRKQPERRWLVLMLLTGVTLVTLGHASSISGFFSRDLQTLLDGVLAPLRNVHKFDILIRLGISLGFAGCLGALGRRGSTSDAMRLRSAVTAVGAFIVVGSAAPFFGLAASPLNAFTSIPSYWQDASVWLATHDVGGRTLLLPGSQFADYQWGYPGDEPIQVLAATSWDVRNAVPLTGPGHVRWLDAVENRLADVGGGADLTSELAAGGVHYVLVRNDLNYGPEGSTRPVLVRLALLSSPGISRVASFGPLVGGPGGVTTFADQKLSLPAAAVEIFAVGDPQAEASVTSTSAVEQVVGGAEVGASPEGSDLFVQVGVGMEDAGANVAATGPHVLTDTPRRREMNTGVGAFGASFTLSMTDPLRFARKVRDYGASDVVGAEAVAAFDDGVMLTASSSAGDADTYPWSDPGALPYAAFDGSLRSEWRPRADVAVTGSWIAAEFGRTVDLRGGAVILGPSTGLANIVVTTDLGTMISAVHGDRAALPNVRTTRVKITFGRVEAMSATTRTPGIRSVQIPGVSVRRSVVLPTAPWTRPPDRIEIRGDVGRTGCAFVGDRPLCGTGIARLGEDAGGVVRDFRMSAPATYTFGLAVRPVPSIALGERISHALDLPVRAIASSQGVPDVVAGPLAAVDGDLGSAWIAMRDDPDPSLTLSWKGLRRLTSLKVLLDANVSATRPQRLTINSPAGSRSADIDAVGTAFFEPLVTNTVTIHFEADTLARSFDPYSLTTSQVGIGVSEVVLPGVTPRVEVSPGRWSTPVVFSCGDGPPAVIGARSVQTSVTTTVGQLLRGALMSAVPCRGATTVQVPAGLVRVSAGQPDVWDVGTLSLTSRSAATVHEPPVGVRAERWTPTVRVLRVAARRTTSTLRVTENSNPGWRATVGGTPLRPAMLNGWQQGWVIPPGGPVTVHLVFAPDRPVRAGMLAGFLLVLPLLGQALVPERSRWHSRVRPGGAFLRRAVLVLGFALLGVVAGVWGFVAAGAVLGLQTIARRPLARRLGALSTGAAAGAAYGGAGLMLLVGPYGSGNYLGNSWLSQLMCVTALSCVLASLRRPMPRLPQRHSGANAPLKLLPDELAKDRIDGPLP